MKQRQLIRRIALIVSFALFPVTLYYFSPILSLQGVAMGVVSGSIMIFGLQFLSALFLGRAFCGWVCPAGGAQEIVLGFKGKRVNRKRVNWIKWLVWTPWAAGLVLMALRAGGITAVDFRWHTWHGISVADLPGLIAFLSVTSVFLVLALSVGRRAACHMICWMAPFMIAGRAARNVFAWPSLRLAAKSDTCRRCGACTKQCPMSLDVQALVGADAMENADCILCGSCVDACPAKTIRYTFSSGR
jgi:polyferredoxin